jgi:HD-like signal output (HDOD) protein
VQALQQRSLRIAELAASMAKLPEDASTAYVAGLLCDVGQLVLVTGAPERLYVTQAEAAQRGVPQHVAELSTWGTTHAEIGAYLLGLWGLPVQIVQAVADHHTPEREGLDHVGLTQLVWLASCIVDDEEPSPELLSQFGAEELYRTHRRHNEEGEP